jgi:hypothetical protein
MRRGNASNKPCDGQEVSTRNFTVTIYQTAPPKAQHGLWTMSTALAVLRSGSPVPHRWGLQGANIARPGG